MLKRFRNIFAKNENNVPINWKTLKPEEVEQKYIHAKKECNELLQNLKHFGIRKRGEDYLGKWNFHKSTLTRVYRKENCSFWKRIWKSYFKT